MSESLIQLRARLSAGELDVETAIADCLARIEANNPELNAFIRIEAEGARAAAIESARRYASGQARALEGLPIAIKDNLDLAGSPTTAGMLTRKHHLADSDAAVVGRLKAAGAVIVGKLHLTEAALGADGANPHFGNCQNPVKPGHSPGGSSSGSAAAVAGGLVPAALGTDTMGSVRIPAAYCGIWGFKPSFGLVSSAGSVAVSRRLDHVGPLTRSAEDLELLLSVMAGFDANCPVSRPLQLTEPKQPFTLGLPDLSGQDLEPAVQQAWMAALHVFKTSDCCVRALPALPLDAGAIRRAGLLLCEAEMLIEHAADWPENRSAFSSPLQALLEWAQQQPAAKLAAAMRRIDQARMAVNRWLAACDFVALPTTPQRAFAHGQPVPVNQADLTCLANCAGLPAISLPLPVKSGELPVGLQLIGRHSTDRGVIQAAAHLHKMLAP